MKTIKKTVRVSENSPITAEALAEMAPVELLTPAERALVVRALLKLRVYEDAGLSAAEVAAIVAYL